MPDDYRQISEEIVALQILIGKVAQHFKSTAISSDNCYDGHKVLKGCQSILEDLYSFIEKYKRLSFINKRLVFSGVKLGKEDIVTLQVRLISNTHLLNGFVRRCVVPAIPLWKISWIFILLFSCEYIEVQAQLAAVLGLHSTRSRVSVASIASFAANINTQTAYKQFCRDLYQIGVTEDMICRKENEILEILGSQGMVARSRMGGSNAGDQGQLLEAGPLSTYVQPLT